MDDLNISIPPASSATPSGPAGGDLQGTYPNPTVIAAITQNSATQTLTNKRVTKRVVVCADATSFTLTADTADENTQANTQSVGTLTANAPSGTPTDGQQLIFRIKSTNIQTYSWNGAFRGSVDIALPVSSSGGGLTDYLGFIYNFADTKWDLIALTQGF